ncbi:MAG: hypothetical protein IT385_17415 [Deltaproteobacteria bacterium]|nr:hypothetical protein [Deltaproteobacteria bacterium]
MRGWLWGLVGGALVACGDDGGSGETTDDTTVADAVAETTAATDTAPVDTTPLNADREFVEVRNILVNGRTTLIADPGEALEVTLGYTIWSAPECPECTHQLVFGVVGGETGCVYDGVPGVHPGVRTNGSVDLVAPTAPGSYEIRWASLGEADCAAATAAFPSATTTLALGFLVR